MTTSVGLRRLAELTDVGWKFMPVYDGGEVDQLNGVRTWPRSDWVDGVMILAEDQVMALRADPGGGVVWMCTGTLDDVAGELLALPHPDDSGAPRLVKFNVRHLWTI